MSYQVIARKYRPQSFADLTGQEHITRTLSNALEQRRLHHAYLFSGARGTGKTTTARILARGLNCQTGISSNPCLTCASCREIAAGSSLDVLEIDAASNTGVDNVRDVIINNISISPARDRYKVFIIDEVHMLSNSAFNALLKTLEEPPAHVAFIMATTELHKVPDTILSRCQQFEFRHIPIDSMTQRLREIAAAEQITIDDAGLREIARAGAGSMRDAQSAFDQVIAFCGSEIRAEDVTASLGLAGEKTLLAFLEAIATQDSQGILRLVDELDSRGYDLRNFTRELMTCLRHLLVIRAGIPGSDIPDVSDVEAAALEQLAPRFSEEDLVRFFHLLATTEKEIKDSPMPRFQLEIGLIRITQSVRLRSLDELITRLEALESRLAGGNGDDSPATRSVPSAPEQKDIPPAGRKTPAERTAGYKQRSSPVQMPDYQPVGPEEPPDFSDSFNRDSFIPEPGLSAGGQKSAARKAEKVTAGSIEPGRERRAILDELERINRHALVTALEDAQSVSYQNGRLTVTMPADDLFAKRLRDSSAVFRDIGERLFGQPVVIEVLIGNGQAVAVDETAQAAADLRERAMRNPAVRNLVEKFRGEITDVRELPA